MTGKIIKGIAGFYYVYVEETKEAKETATGGTLYECKAKGTFRKQKDGFHDRIVVFQLFRIGGLGFA